jgi:hypothetical protein
MRIRFRRREDGKREYDVFVQDQPRGRWQEAGRVSGLGEPPEWIALGKDADAWTEWKSTRRAAVADMVTGRTFRTAREDAAARAAERHARASAVTSGGTAQDDYQAEAG